MKKAETSQMCKCTSLHYQTEDILMSFHHCSYGELQDEIIRDCTVASLQDAALSDKLQLELELPLKLRNYH